MKRPYNLNAWDAMLGDGAKQATGKRTTTAHKLRLQRKAAYQLAANTGHIHNGWFHKH